MDELQPLPAATITLVRDAPGGVQVLMLQRNLKSAFIPGAHVFPGGTLDADDHDAALQSRCDGPDDPAASRVLGVAAGGLAYWIAAIRELFEEAGVLLARDKGGGLLGAAHDTGRYGAQRRHVESGATPFSAFVTREDLRLAADQLTYFSHWITPVGAVRRYDTRFFAAPAPPAQVAAHDNKEAIAHEWVRPADMLDRHRRRECNLRTPTLHTLRRFADFSSAASLLADLASQGDIPAITPRIRRDGRPVLPGEPGYEEAATAEGRGEWRSNA